MKNVFFAAIGLLIITLFSIIYFQNEKIKELQYVPPQVLDNGDIDKAHTTEALYGIIDSLHAENYPCQIELNRFKVAYEIFLKRNPKAAHQYGTIISEETE